MPLTILNFHGVGQIHRNLEDGERNCCLEVDNFEEILDLVRARADVRLTFDDGNASDFEIVLPALLRRGMQAIFFICSGRLDKPGFLSRKQVLELQLSGMQIGSHGVSHRSWRKMKADELGVELKSSRQALEDICGVSVNVAACPFGDYDRGVLKHLRLAGYLKVYTSDGGTAREDHWLQARTTITRSTPRERIQRLARFGPTAWEQFSIDFRKLAKRHR